MNDAVNPIAIKTSTPNTRLQMFYPILSVKNCSHYIAYAYRVQYTHSGTLLLLHTPMAVASRIHNSRGRSRTPTDDCGYWDSQFSRSLSNTHEDDVAYNSSSMQQPARKGERVRIMRTTSSNWDSNMVETSCHLPMTAAMIVTQRWSMSLFGRRI